MSKKAFMVTISVPGTDLSISTKTNIGVHWPEGFHERFSLDTLTAMAGTLASQWSEESGAGYEYVMGRLILKEVYLDEEHDGHWEGTHIRVTEIKDATYVGFITGRNGSAFDEFPINKCRDK